MTPISTGVGATSALCGVGVGATRALSGRNGEYRETSEHPS